MTESNAASAEELDVWEYVKKNKKLIGFPLSDNSGLDILSALADVYENIDKDPAGSKKMLTLIVTVMLSAISGHGDEVVSEIRVSSAMDNFDENIKEILDEKS
jgi:hypothetical protein